jgi:DNA helicase II / ATP-dependent DNA helicase PcrA
MIKARPPLDEDQKIAANSIFGNFVVISGPGSGKTTVTLERTNNMLLQGIPPTDIRNLTFSRAAAEEMQERSGIVTDEKMFQTFDAFALGLIQRERAHVPFPLCESVIDPGAEFELLKDLMKIYPAITTFSSLKDKIKGWQSSNTSPDEAMEETYRNPSTTYFYAAAYKDYEQKCRERGFLDFYGITQEVTKLLEGNDEIRIRNTRKFISVDECQDTSTTQFKLLQLIYGGNIFAVGDECQLIYEFRSARAGNLTDFGKVFPGTKTLYLGNNYRSTQKIVGFLKKIIPVDNGLASRMVSMREEGVSPTFTKFGDEYEEASIVVKCAQPDFADSAIIARTNRQLLTVQRVAMALGIKSRVVGRKNLWEQSEVRELLKLAKASNASEAPAYEALTSLMKDHNLVNRYRNTGSPNEKDPVENLHAVIKMSATRGTLQEFLKWLNKLIYGAKSDKTPALTLGTVHQMKGREAKHVYVIGAKQGLMPHKDGELKEEHRILFVACSRAADNLNISWYGAPSQFILDFEKEFETYGENQEAD